MKPAPAPSRRYARRLLRFLNARGSRLSPLLILMHDFPDPDTLASAAALAYICEKGYGIESRIAYGGIIGRMENRAMVRLLRIPARKLGPRDLKRFENVALLDTQPCFQNNPFPAARRAALVIDQHPCTAKSLADLMLVDSECGATSVILVQALLLARLEIPARIATALAYGILSDTANLYRSKRPDVIDAYVRILPFCDLKTLAVIQNPNRSKRFFSTLARGIQNAWMRRGLVLSHLGPVESPDLAAQIADFLITYKKARWAVCTGRYKNKLHVSLRTAGSPLDAGQFLRDIFPVRAQAGGHSGIAGGSFEIRDWTREDAWSEAERNFDDRLLRRLRLPVTGEAYYPFR